MKGPNDELLQKAQKMQPLFKTKEVNEEAFKQQDTFKQQFEEQQQFQTVQEETTKETHEEQLANSFKVEEAEKIKEDGDDPQEPQPDYISLSYSTAKYEDYDDEKLGDVEQAIMYYHNVQKGSNSFENLSETLMNVIKACDKYTWGKFSLFCFGKTKVKLREVKKVRADAEKALKDLIQKKKEEKQKEREEAIAKLVHDESNFAPNVDVSDRNVPVEEVNNLKSEKLIEDRAKALTKRFKDYSFVKDAELIARREAEEGRQYTDKELVKQLGNAIDQANFDVEEIVQNKLNSMSAVKRFFTNLFGKSALKAEAMQLKVKELKRRKDLGYF